MVKASRKKAKSPKTIDLDKKDFVAETDASAQTDAALEAAKLDKVDDANIDADLPNADEVSENTADKAEELAQETANEMLPVKKKSRFGLILGTFLAATAGGALALGGAGALNKMGWLEHIPYASGLVYGGNGSANENVVGAEQIKALENQILTLKTAAPEIDPAALEERLNAIEASIGATSGETNSQMETSLATALDTSASANDSAKEALAKVEELSNLVTSGTGENAEGGVFNAEFAAVKTNLDAQIKALQNRLATMEASSQDSAQFVSGIGNLTSDISKLNERIEKLSVQGVQNSDALVALNQKIDVDVLEPMAKVQSAADAAVNGIKVARSVNVNALQSALENGGVFKNEVLAVEALLGESDEINALKPIAEAGVLTPSQLLASFNPVEDQILASLEAPLEKSNFVDKLMASAKSLVKVRKKGPQLGDDATAVASRIRDALSAGDASKAKSEWNGLSASAKDISMGWSKDLDARVSAEEMVSKLIEALSVTSNN
ncbi:MAG: COG4223 family protein [Nitratireductor sp.]